MIRVGIFVIGFGMLLLGAASHFERVPKPIDCRSIACTLGYVTLTLDVVLMVAGVFLILVAWVFHRLNKAD